MKRIFLSGYVALFFASLAYAQEGTPMAAIDEADLERMKWYGYFYRKNNDNNHYMCRVRIPGCTMTAKRRSCVPSTT